MGSHTEGENGAILEGEGMEMMDRVFCVRMDDECYAKLRKLAKRESRSMSNLVLHLCRQKLEEYEREHGELTVSDEELYG